MIYKAATPEEVEAAQKRAQTRIGYALLDSGERQVFSTGMVRDTTEFKADYSLVYDGPMLGRLAAHLTKGARKYTARNWMKAATEEELQRFISSACRHFNQWVNGDQDEDHAAAVAFNINGAEYVKERLASDEAARARARNAWRGTLGYVPSKT